MKKEWEESRWQRVARYRLGNGTRGNWYWEEEEKRKCRMCGCKSETWEHVWEECVGWEEERGWQEIREIVLGENGEREEWLRKLEVVRGESEGREKGESEWVSERVKERVERGRNEEDSREEPEAEVPIG